MKFALATSTTIHIAAAAALLALSSCSTTGIARSYADPSAQGKSFTKLGVIALTNQEVYRREAEHGLVQELGGRGVASYMLMPELRMLRDTAQVIATLREAGCDGIVTMQLKSGAVRPDASAPPSTSTSVGQVADDYWVDPSAQQAEGFANGQFFSVEVHVFDMALGKMVYNGLVITQNAENTADLVRLVRDDVMRDLREKGLVGK